MTNQSQSGQILNQLTANLVQNTQISINLGGVIITTTEDKVRLAVHTHLSKMELRYAWIGPAGVFATILATLLTTTFKEFILPAAVWHAIFVICLLVSLGVTVWLGVRASKAPSVDDFVSSLRATNTNDPIPDTTEYEALLVKGEWVLVFGKNPLTQSKRIIFLPQGQLSEGKNGNENAWRLSGSSLEFLDAKGSVYSRFTFDGGQKRWVQTQDSETARAKGQYMYLK